MTDGTVNSKRRAMAFIVLLGTVSLFADMTYEGARSITGPFLALLGASSVAVGVVAGLGEFGGYAVRLLSGTIADRTRRYWTLTIIGYCVNLLAVPALALAGNWPAAAALMIAERVGKGIRNPPRDVMLSAAGSRVGRGWGFGFHEAMDQIGATLGPLLVALMLYLGRSHRATFAVLLGPAVVAITIVTAARMVYPHPGQFEEDSPTRPSPLPGSGFPRAFWLYLAAVCLIAAGFADFPLIAFHFQKTGVVGPNVIPILYAVAMVVDALSALAFGRLLDRIGMTAMIISAVLALAFAPLVFAGGLPAAIIGMALWGIGMGAHESIMRAVVADMVPVERRGRAYGVFNAAYGTAWFAGSAALGLLYGLSIPAVIVFSLLVQLLAIPLLVVVARRPRTSDGVT